MPNRKSKRNIKKQRRNRPRRSLQGAGLGHVPPFVPTISLSHRFRFTNGTNAGSYLITRGNVLNLILYATSAITSVRLFEAVRVKRVEIWSNPTALGSAPTSVSLEWLGVQGPSTFHSDTTMGVSPAHIVTQPPANSSDRWWSMSGQNEADNLFGLSLPADSVVDVTLELRLVETEAPTAGDVPAGAALGQLYGDYLDGLSSGKLAPVGYTPLP